MKQYEKWLRKNATSLAGKHAVITGANSGIGYACAAHLLSLGAKVTLVCRNEARGRAACEQLQNSFPKGELSLALLDLAARASIEAFLQYVRQRGEKIDIFLHCAGVYYPKEQHTADGLPTTLGVNYWGTVYLTEQILPLMGEQGRVIFTSSLVDRFGKHPARAVRGKQGEGYAQYADSKHALSAYAVQRAAKRAPGEPAFLAVHPGITATSLLDPAKTSHNPLFSRIGHAFLFLFTHKKEKAALTAVLAACRGRNGDCIGPRGLFGISGYPHVTAFCRPVRKTASRALPRFWGA